MSADVVISEVPTRSYTVPSALSEDLGERVNVDRAYDTLQNGSDEARQWAARIIDGFERSRVERESSVLASIGYDDKSYDYIGLTASADDDLIFAVARATKRDTNIRNAEILSQDAMWRPISDDLATSCAVSGVAMDAPLVAYTASAFAEGCRGVYLAYGEPLMFFESQPILSTLVAAASSASPDGLVYAVVDGTDTTAVMDVIMIAPGPQVYRRDGGAWVLDSATLDSLLSVSPPPIVELLGDMVDTVLEQVDGSQANQMAPTGDGFAEAGPNSIDGSEPIADEAVDPAVTPAVSDTPSTDTYSTNQNKSQLKDGSTAQTAALLSKYDTIEALTASVRGLWSEFDDEVSTIRAKQKILEEASNLRDTLLVREAQLTNIYIPALTADAQSIHDATPNQRKATHLRKYWVRGKGAVKIRWGTPGDFTRCERQLRKYLGARAPGYCAKRHKEVMGFWPGDKRNTGKTHGVGTPLTAAKVVRTAAGVKQAETKKKLPTPIAQTARSRNNQIQVVREES